MRKTFLVFWIFLGALFIFMWIYFPVLSRYRELRSQNDQIEQELSDLDQKITELTREKSLLKDDVQYLEKVIRDEMGLVRPGEIVYKFVEDSEETPQVSPAPEPPPALLVPPASSPASPSPSA